MRYIYIPILLLTFGWTVQAQTNDFGVWLSASAQKNFGKLDLSSELELRTKEQSHEIDRWSVQLETGYNLLKSLKAGVGYQLIQFHDTEYSDYQWRHRTYFFLQGKQKLGDFTLSIRERVQITTKDEADRIKSNGETNTYQINPDISWRNRFKLSYNIPHFALTPSFSFESFYQLNNPEGNEFDKLRYALALDYKLSKRHEIEIYTLMDKDIHVSDPVQTVVIGAGYSFNID